MKSSENAIYPGVETLPFNLNEMVFATGAATEGLGPDPLAFGGAVSALVKVPGGGT